MGINEIIDNIYLLPAKNRSLITEHCRKNYLPKGTVLCMAGKIEKKVYFIANGLVRAYAETKEGEVTFWFGREGDAVVSMCSYVSGVKGYENIELLENSLVYEADAEFLDSLYNKDILIANWGRKFAEKELVRTEERIIASQFRTASQRYADLLEKDPDLIRRVPLGHIASFLGITQVSLSRIRAELK